MEKINTEILVSSLFKVGFDKVDSVLYTFVLGQLKIDNNNAFKFEDAEFSELFKKYVDYNSLVYRLKDGITLDTMVDAGNKHYYPLKRMLNINRKLIEGLNTLDYKKIIVKKISFLGVENLNKFDLLFSNKEKEIISDMFGIANMYKQHAISQSKTYHDLYNQECEDLVLLTKGLQRFKK